MAVLLNLRATCSVVIYRALCHHADVAVALTCALR